MAPGAGERRDRRRRENPRALQWLPKSVGRLGSGANFARCRNIPARAAVAYAMARPPGYWAATEPWRSREPSRPTMVSKTVGRLGSGATETNVIPRRREPPSLTLWRALRGIGPRRSLGEVGNPRALQRSRNCRAPGFRRQ